MRRWLALCLLLACDGDGPADPGPRIECDTSLQNCPAGQTCDLVCDSLGSKVTCRPVPATSLPAGSACTGSEACGAGTGCFATGTGGPVCVKYCSSNTDCTAGSCQVRRVLRGCATGQQSYMIKFCLP